MKISKLILSFVLSTTLFTQILSAQMASTEAVMGTSVSSKEKLVQLIAREDVKNRFEAMGIDPAMVQTRIASMTDEEASKISHQIDTLPAGADGGATLIGAVVFIFVLLLITDLLGWTKVFNFTKPIVNK
jgi:hypothetical protein